MDPLWGTPRISTDSPTPQSKDLPPIPPSFQLDTSIPSAPPPAHFESSSQSRPTSSQEYGHMLSASITSPVLIPNNKNRTGSAITMAKAAPADPHTTKADVESHLSSSCSSSINDSVSELAERVQKQKAVVLPSTPVQQQIGFFNNMISAATSLSFNRSKNMDDSMNVDAETTMTPVGANNTTGSVEESDKINSSPGMITYKRSKSKSNRRKTASISSIELPESPLSPAEKPVIQQFDPKLYADEKFKDTPYHFASTARNEEFHKLFKSIPTDERLLDDFSCALSREILLQGRIYVSERNLCFNSNLLGWVTNLIISFEDIEGFDKTATVGLFPNGIAVRSKDGVKSFASFISRDNVYQFLTDVWSSSGRVSEEESSANGPGFIGFGAPVLTKQLDMNHDTEFNAAMMSIDGDSPLKRRMTNITMNSTSTDSDDEIDEEDESDSTDSWTGVSETKTTNQSVYSLKPESNFSYSGSHAHPRTKCPYDPEANKEHILARENLKCPPGVLYELLFGPNTDMVLEFLKSQDSRDFSSFSAYEPNDEGKKERHYEYIKGLNFSMGPKQTKCLVKETIEHLDYDGYIHVINTTQTPDVPSGGAFCVKTRYLMSWGPNNTTDLVVSFWVHWMGSSWVKSVIESSTKSGQESAIAKLMEIVKMYVDENVEEKVEEVKITESRESLVKVELEAPEEMVVPPMPTKSSWTDTFQSVSAFQAAVAALLIVVILLQMMILKAVQTPGISPSHHQISVLDDIERYTGDVLFRAEEVLIWNWIDERAGKSDLTKSEKAQMIQQEIDNVLVKWSSGELNSQEGKDAIRNFEKSMNEYAALSGEDQAKDAKIEELRRAIKALL